MTRNVEFLDPAKKLVDEVVAWLCKEKTDNPPSAGSPHVKVVDGAHSLAHVMVVVPTAQSGRNLRLALAREAAKRQWGGIIPPKITMANPLLVPAESRVATEAEELAVLAEVLARGDPGAWRVLIPNPPPQRSMDWALGLAGMILEIQSVLGERALLMSEVSCAGDAERWRDLASIEKDFFAALTSKGVTPRGLARRQACAAGCREEGVEEIILPSGVDLSGAFETYLTNSSQSVTILVHADSSNAGMFDDWGRPVGRFVAPVRAYQIDAAPTAVIEADDIARQFRSVKPSEALPALVVCDAEMYTELEGSFQNHFLPDELVLRNPAHALLSHASLGRLLGAIVALGANDDYETFSTFVRMGDVARWARERLGVSAAEIATFVGALDAVQNAHLPRTLDETIAAARTESEQAWRSEDRAAAAGLQRLAEAIREEVSDPVGFVKRIFASLTLDEHTPGDRELIAAAEVVRSLRADCNSPIVPPHLRGKLFARLLDSATYMIEPTAGNVLATTGWLELAWCPEDEIVFAGFNEGCVPENIVGHPFVPDSLRARLGLMTNAVRERRDAFLFAEALACRDPAGVSIHLHQVAGDKNVMKPSRILFDGVADCELPSLARRLYAVTKGNEGAPRKELPSAWFLKLPMPPEGVVFREKISPTALDQYLRCPFTFFLQETFGAHTDDRHQELDDCAFGTLCHAALEQFARVGPKDSSDADEIARFLTDEVWRQLSAFGPTLPTIVELQGEAAIERLRAFASHQAARRRAGWRIVASEQRLSCRIKGCPTLLSGKVDRIDEHERTGEMAIIDYKTWKRADATKYTSVQLPVYRAMVESSGRYAQEKAHRAKAFYCVLAERPEDVCFDEAHACHEGNQSEHEDEIVRLLTSLAHGIFYPPERGTDGGKAWMRDYGELIGDGPEASVDPAWIADQKKRKEAYA